MNDRRPGDPPAERRVWILGPCSTCGLCEAIAPDVFEVTPDGSRIRPGAPSGLPADVFEAARLCPDQAIRLSPEGSAP
jgi:ferredoxin